LPAATRPRDARNLRFAEELYASNRPRLLAIARRNSACEQDAEEALQDALALFICHFDPRSSAPPLAWLTLTLKRRCWAIGKRQRRQGAGRKELDPERDVDPHRRPHEQAEAQEAIDDGRRQLGRLKPAERRALVLYGIGCTYKEICELTGWTYTKVNRCLSEGRAALRKARADSGDTGKGHRGGR
jgi:RNA polymerase sigma factor (sigma-70 family)